MLYDSISDVLFHTEKGQYVSAFIYGLGFGILILYSVRREINKGFMRKEYESNSTDEYTDHPIAK